MPLATHLHVVLGLQARSRARRAAARPRRRTMTLSIPAPGSRKIWMAPSWASSSHALDELLALERVSTCVMRAKCSGENVGICGNCTRCSARAHRIADGEDARVEQAHDVAGIGLVHRSRGRRPSSTVPVASLSLLARPARGTRPCRARTCPSRCARRRCGRGGSCPCSPES